MNPRNKLFIILFTAGTGIFCVAVLLVSLSSGGKAAQAAKGVDRPVGLVTPSGDSAMQTPVEKAVHETGNLVAIVNNESISQEEWQKAAGLDLTMNSLAGKSVLSPEETLDRLINEHLIQQASRTSGQTQTASRQQAQERLAALEKQWGVNEGSLNAALARAGITRWELLDEVVRLLDVENYLKEVAENQDPGAWLAAERKNAQVSIYSSLVKAQPQEEGTMASLEPTPTQPAPLPTPTPAAAAVPEGSLEGQLAPDFSLPGISGQNVRLSGLRGSPVVIAFWTTWCPVCKRELPNLEAAYGQLREKGVQVLGVNIRETPEKVSQFAQSAGLSFPLLLDQDAAVANQYLVRGVPTFLVIDARGVVVARRVGPFSDQEIRQIVEPLLPSSQPEKPQASRLAPDFSLPRENGDIVKLSEILEKQNVVLVFYRGQT